MPLLLPHLPKGIGQIVGRDLFGVLKLQKLVTPMTCHVDQDVAALVRHKALRSGHVLGDSVGHEPYEVLHGDLVSSVVDFDVVSVEVQGAVGVVVNGAGECVARVAGHVVGQHEDDLRVGDAEALHGTVEREDICEVPVVEPEARRADEDRPVGRVLGGRERSQQEGHQRCGELHVGCASRVPSFPTAVVVYSIRCTVDGVQ